MSLCDTCWCYTECQEVNGETLCGVLRIYYSNPKNRKETNNNQL